MVPPRTQELTVRSSRHTLLAAKLFDGLAGKRLTGGWEGARSQLEKSGVTLELTSNTQFMVNIHGGRETKNGNDLAASYNLDLILDFEKMDLIPGASLIFEAKGASGGEVSDFDTGKIGGSSRPMPTQKPRSRSS